jgi:hypothetical protein
MRFKEIVRLDELGKIVPGVNTTVDIKTDAIRKQAMKFGNKVTDDGLPPIIRSDGKVHKPYEQ